MTTLILCKIRMISGIYRVLILKYFDQISPPILYAMFMIVFYKENKDCRIIVVKRCDVSHSKSKADFVYIKNSNGNILLIIETVLFLFLRNVKSS